MQSNSLNSPYTGSNLDALQERVAQIVIGLGILDHQPTPERVTDIINTLNRIQAQAREYGNKLIRLIGEREMALIDGREPMGSTYPLIAMISNTIIPDACMLWVPGNEHFYRVIAYYGEGFDNDRRFDGNTIVFDEGIFRGSGHYCCKVDSWGRVDNLRSIPRNLDDPLLLNDPLGGWVRELLSCLQNISPSYKLPLVCGTPSDRSTWNWYQEARGFDVIVLGNIA